MDDRPDLDLGPDPRLNGRGVALTREQRRILTVVGVLIGAGLVLALAGLAYGFPSGGAPAGPVATGSGPFTAVVGGSGTATVSVEQDGAVTTASVPLPWTVPVEATATAVTIEAALQGRGGVEGIACIVRDGSGALLQQQRDAGLGAAVRCSVRTP